jgi:hypothetical protein
MRVLLVQELDQASPLAEHPPSSRKRREHRRLTERKARNNQRSVTPTRIAESERTTFLAAIQRSSLALDATWPRDRVVVGGSGRRCRHQWTRRPISSRQAGGRGPREERCAPARQVTTIEVFVAANPPEVADERQSSPTDGPVTQRHSVSTREIDPCAFRMNHDI